MLEITQPQEDRPKKGVEAGQYVPPIPPQKPVDKKNPPQSPPKQSPKR